MTAELERWAIDDLGLDHDTIHFENAKFCDHWWDKPGAAGLKLTWDRTWKNWMRNVSERQPKRPANSYSRNGAGTHPKSEETPEARAEREQLRKEALARANGGKSSFELWQEKYGSKTP